MSIVATAPGTAGILRTRVLPLGASTGLAALALSVALALPENRPAGPAVRLRPRVAPAPRPEARWYRFTLA